MKEALPAEAKTALPNRDGDKLQAAEERLPRDGPPTRKVAGWEVTGTTRNGLADLADANAARMNTCSANDTRL